MGALAAADMAAHADLDQALAWHLQVNHYPPVPKSMTPVCKAAIMHAVDGDWESDLDLPPWVTHNGNTYASVRAIVEQHHLEPFIALDEDDR